MAKPKLKSGVKLDSTRFNVTKRTESGYDRAVDNAVNSYFKKHPKAQSLQKASFTVSNTGKKGMDSIKALIATGAQVKLVNCADNKNKDLLMLKYAADALRDSLQAKNKKVAPDQFSEMLFKQLKQMKKAGMAVNPYDMLPKSVRGKAADKIQQNMKLPQVVPGWFGKTSYRLKNEKGKPIDEKTFQAAADILLDNINKKGRTPTKTTATIRKFDSNGVDAIKTLIAAGVKVTIKDFKGTAEEKEALDRLNKAAETLRKQQPPVKPQDFAKLLAEKVGTDLLPKSVLDKVQPKLDANVKATLKSVGSKDSKITENVKNARQYQDVINRYFQASMKQNPDMKGVATIRNFGPKGTDALKSLIATGKRVKIIDFKGNEQQKKELVQLQMAAALVRNDLRKKNKAVNPKEFPDLLEDKLYTLKREGLKVNPKILPVAVVEKANKMAENYKSARRPVIAPEDTKKPKQEKASEKKASPEVEAPKQVRSLTSANGDELRQVRGEDGTIKADLRPENRGGVAARADGVSLRSTTPAPQPTMANRTWSVSGQQEVKNEVVKEKSESKKEAVEHTQEQRAAQTTPTPKPGTTNPNAQKLEDEKLLLLNQQQQSNQLRRQKELQQQRTENREASKPPGWVASTIKKQLLEKAAAVGAGLTLGSWSG